MPNNPRIKFPADGEGITVSSAARVFIAQGRVALDPGANAVGVSGHLVTPGTNTVKAVGNLVAWHRTGRRENVFHWSVLFDLGDIATIPDGNYDVILSTYLGGATVKTATENNSSAKSEGVGVTTRAGLGISVSFPANGASINGNLFMPYGAYSAGDKPTRATMTEDTSGAVTSAGTIFTSGGANGYWYAAFGSLATGTYTLDVLGGTAVKTVTGLIV